MNKLTEVKNLIKQYSDVYGTEGLEELSQYILFLRVEEVLSGTFDGTSYESSYGEFLLWKEFILHFKRTFFPEERTQDVTECLRKILNIDQEKDVKSGIKKTFLQWIKK